MLFHSNQCMHFHYGFLLLVLYFFFLFFHMCCALHRYRFVELYYRRKGRNDPAKTQTVVIFLPDVRSCVPTRTEWDELNAKYKHHFETTVKKGSEGVDNNNSGDGGDARTAEIVDGSPGNVNGSSAVGLTSEGDAVHATNESDKTKTTASVGDRGEAADGEAAPPNNNEKALLINCYFYFLYSIFYLCLENILNLKIYLAIIRISKSSTFNDRDPGQLEVDDSASRNNPLTHLTRTN